MNNAVAVVGEGVIDRFVAPDGSTDVIGGSPLNTAVALRRAGVEAHWWGRMSSGPEGSALIEYAQSNNVDGVGIHTVDQSATIVTIRLDQNGVPTYGFHLEGAADWGWSESELDGLQNYSIVQVGSLATVIEPGSTALLRKLQTLANSPTKPLISYDPNARPSAFPREHDAQHVRGRVAQFVQISDLIKVSDEDLVWLHPGIDPHVSAATWSTQGPSLVVMTRGEAGAIAFREGMPISSIPGVKTHVVDTVGAGDTFMAWLLRGIVRDHHNRLPTEISSISVLLEQAASAAAITCSRAGCNPPLYLEVL